MAPVSFTAACCGRDDCARGAPIIILKKYTVFYLNMPSYCAMFFVQFCQFIILVWAHNVLVLTPF